MLNVLKNQQIPISKVKIQKTIAQPHKAQLEQAKEMMENYLKDKNFKISIKDSFLHGKDCVDITAFADSKKAISDVTIKKNGEIPFIENVRNVLEYFVKEGIVNNPKL